MAADAWRFYDTFHLWLADATFDLDADTFNMALFLSTSNCATLSNSVLASLTNQHANANGYLTGGKSITGVTWTLTGAVAKLTGNDTVWTAAGGSIVARHAVIYKLGTANARVNPLVCTALLNNTPADETAGDSNTFTIRPAATGFITVTG